jgi:hypothetical protein
MPNKHISVTDFIEMFFLNLYSSQKSLFFMIKCLKKIREQRDKIIFQETDLQMSHENFVRHSFRSKII